MIVSEERKREREREGDRLFCVHEFISIISFELDVSKGSFGIFLKKFGSFDIFSPIFLVICTNFPQFGWAECLIQFIFAVEKWAKEKG